MKLIETTISDTSVHMRIADNSDPAKAKQWIDFQVPLDALLDPEASQEIPLGPASKRHLRSIRAAALRHARGLIVDEIQNPSGP